MFLPKKVFSTKNSVGVRLRQNVFYTSLSVDVVLVDSLQQNFLSPGDL